MELQVPCTRVDDFIAGEAITGPLSAWIDVEGALSLVMAGLEGVLDDFQMIFCEVEDVVVWDGQWTWRAVQEFMAKHGFHAVARDFQSAGQNNVVFLHEKLMFRADVRDALAQFFSGVAWPLKEVEVDSTWRPWGEDREGFRAGS